MTRFTTIEVRRDGHVVIVTFRAASLECAGEQEHLLREELRRLLDSTQTTRVVFDLCGVVKCSSGSLGALIETQKLLEHRSGRLSLCRLEDTLRDKLRTLNLEGTVFAVYASECEAIAAFQE